tara:strand:- start:55 stop:573 length:519 start_codon:yes stop_codon:yes gene_type:complete
MLWELVTNIASGIGQVFSAKYYVTQQLAQMQAHNINRDNIVAKAGGPSKKVIKEIFKQYDKLIQAQKWAWVKKKGEVYAVQTQNKAVKDINGKYHNCKMRMHYGVFPPTPTIEASLTECEEKWEIDVDEDYLPAVKKEMAGFVNAYASNLEYWVLTLEALLQDMAISKPWYK